MTLYNDHQLSANQCLTSIITKLGSMDLPNQKQELVDYILNQVKVTCISDQSYLISLLQLITVVSIRSLIISSLLFIFLKCGIIWVSYVSFNYEGFFFYFPKKNELKFPISIIL